MLSHLKNFIKRLMGSIVFFLGLSKIGSALLNEILVSAMNSTRKISRGETQLIFSVPNRLNQYRVDSFSDKEPETLEWIDNFSDRVILWDIGANIGLYSCYAAKAKKCEVYAFEPSIFNLELLARNVYLNNLTSAISIIPLPLSNKLGLNRLNMTSTEWGGALSTFGQEYGWNGEKLAKIFDFQTVGISADEALNLLKLPQPNHLKIDVDGIEHLILSGAERILKAVDSVLIEINDNFFEQADQCEKLLKAAGLVLSEKRHSEFFNSSESFGGGKVWNQIWNRA